MDETLILLLAAIFFLALYIWGVRDLEKWDKRAQYAQALLTLLALLTTGYWFFLERKGKPHADVAQEVIAVPLDSGLVAVETHISITNLGQRLLLINKINSRLQLVRPDAYGYVTLDEKKGEEYWSAKRPNSPRSPEQFQAAELRWPVYRQYDDKVEHRIEPGETDLLVVTYLVSCNLADWVRVATDVYKPKPVSFGKARDNEVAVDQEGLQDSNQNDATEEVEDQEVEFAWKARSFLKIRDVCATTGDLE